VGGLAARREGGGASRFSYNDLQFEFDGARVGNAIAIQEVEGKGDGMKPQTRILVLAAAALAVLVAPTFAGEYHASELNVCYDCHTMHYSMQHEWESETGPIVPGGVATGGNWLGAGGPYHYLLKADANLICLQCHDGQSFAPDVYGDNANPTYVRSAGALNGTPGTYTPGTDYEDRKGHTLDSTATPPGYDASLSGFGAYDPAGGLKCFNCHTQHGRTNAYRNLGPRRSTSPNADFIVSYSINTTFDPAVDVTVGLPSYTPLGGAPFDQYYAVGSVSYGRTDTTHGGGTLESSNNIDRMCSSCHGMFHGGAGDTEIGGIANPLGAGFVEFERHPTSGVTIGQVGGGHSSLTGRYANAASINKVKVYADNQTTFADASPGCVSCHKAHGNKNPFGLIFMNRLAGTVTEEGTGTVITDGLRDLCGQCHVQGN
jgi:hypothetical protein